MRRTPIVAVLSLTLYASSCGGAGEGKADAGNAQAESGSGGELADNIVIQNDDLTVDDATTATTTEPSSAVDTIPQDELDPDEEFFDSVGTFMGCMDARSNGFIGVPDGSEDRDETLAKNQPAYLEALSECAASSEIVSKMAAAEDSTRFAPEEIEERNRGFIGFRDCMIGRGWSIPEPIPDKNGLLFSNYAEPATSWLAPAGESLLESDDLNECAVTSNPLGADEQGDESS